MKLIELVTKSFEIIGGGWPENVVAMSQGRDCMIHAYIRCDDIVCLRPDYMINTLCLAIDFDTALVTRDQYEAALAASQKVEWDGVGLPPVGCECEVAQPGQIIWDTFKVIAVESGTVFGFFNNGVSGAALTGDCWSFRPIRSEADKKRDESLRVIYEILDAGTSTKQDAADIYDAIAACKIPGVKLED